MHQEHPLPTNKQQRLKNDPGGEIALSQPLQMPPEHAVQKMESMSFQNVTR